MMHEHHLHDPGVSTAWVGVEIVAAIVLIAVATLYVVSVLRLRGVQAWPVWRSALWLVGVGCLALGMIGPLARVATTGFTEHMLVHLLIGMIGPLLLVLAAPVTLALRVLPTSSGRILTTVLRSRPVRVISHPVTAAVLNAGGLWLLYTTPLYQLRHENLTVHVLVHVHVIIAGTLFTASLISPDPIPHRAGFRVRAGVMVAFIAMHSVLGKWLYAYPPEGVGAQDARTGAQVMYYGGDMVDVLILVLLFAGWYSGRPRPSLLRPHAIRSTGAPQTKGTSPFPDQ